MKRRLVILLIAGSVALLQAQSGGTPQPSPAPALNQPRVPFDPGEKSKCRIYLLMGQSNMVGRDIATIGQQTTDPRIGYLAGDGKWYVAIEPIHDGGSGIGPGIPFAREMLKQDDGIRIALVPSAVGGSALRRWEKGAPLYEEAVRRARIAMQSGELAGVLWHQGETDSDIAETAASYEMRLTQMFTALRQDLGKPDLPVVVGQLGPFARIPYVEVVKAALVRVPGDLPSVGFADSAGLTDRGDWLHFDAASQEKMGQRYAEAMRKLQVTTLQN